MTLVNVLGQNKPFVIVNSNNIDWFEVTFIPENEQVASLKEKIELLCNQFKFEQEYLIYEFLYMLNDKYKFLYCDKMDMCKKYYSLYSIDGNSDGETVTASIMMYGMNDVTSEDANLFLENIKNSPFDLLVDKQFKLTHDTDSKFSDKHVDVVEISSFDKDNHIVLYDLLEYLEQCRRYPNQLFNKSS